MILYISLLGQLVDLLNYTLSAEYITGFDNLMQY